MWFGHNACQVENEYLRSAWNQIYQNIKAMFYVKSINTNSIIIYIINLLIWIWIWNEIIPC